MLKAIIFDFDGTLSNRTKNAYDFFFEYFRKYFTDFSDLEYEAVMQDMLIYDCNGTIPNAMRTIPLINKYGDHLPENLPETFAQDFLDYMYTTCVLKDETISVLEKLKLKYKLGLLSNGDSKSQHAKIKKVDVAKYFDEIIVSGDYGVHKPDKRIFEIMANKLGVNCNECLMIGDVFSNDILGADNAGMIPLWLCIDNEKPANYYSGYRIDKIEKIFDVLKQIEGE